MLVWCTVCWGSVMCGGAVYCVLGWFTLRYDGGGGGGDISQIFYPPISHIPDFVSPNIPYPRFHSQLTISQILQD